MFKSTEIRVAASPFSCWVTLYNLLDLSVPQLLICKMRIMVDNVITLFLRLIYIHKYTSFTTALGTQEALCKSLLLHVLV